MKNKPWKPNKEAEAERLKQQLANLERLREKWGLIGLMEKAQEQPAKSTPISKNREF